MGEQRRSERRILVTLPVTEGHKRRLAEAAAGAELLCERDMEKIRELIETVDGVIGNLPPELLKRNRNLGWVQLSSAGTDGYTKEGVLPVDTVLTNATGAYGLAISEHMVGMVLSLLKKFPKYLENQRQHLWKDEGMVRSVYGSRVLIVGLGDIGMEFAVRMKAFGSYIVGIRRTIHEKPDCVDELYTMDALKEELGKADIVASCLPGTEATRGLFGSAMLHSMKRGAVFLNVGRGTAVDTDALAEALREGYLLGAGVDVTEPEPLPPESPLWDCENVIITPHVSGGFHLEYTLDRIVEISCRNLRAYLGEGEYVSPVDRSTGYKRADAGIKWAPFQGISHQSE